MLVRIDLTKNWDQLSRKSLNEKILSCQIDSGTFSSFSNEMRSRKIPRAIYFQVDLCFD